MLILLFGEIVILLVLYCLARKKYAGKIAAGAFQDDRLKNLIPAGLFVLDIMKRRNGSRYAKKLEARLHELGDPNDSRNLLSIFLARKVVIVLGTIVFVTFIGSQIERDTSFYVFAAGLPVLMFFILDKQLDKKIKERRRSLQIEFPEFLNMLVLLMNAGLSISASIRRITQDGRKSGPLQQELLRTLNEVNAGKPELQSFEDLARRCRLQEISLFVSTLIQNLKKGNDELVPILRIQANSCWENRKNIARKLGEEAATKLIIPMMLIFVAIMIMIMTPAFLQIKF